MPYRLDEPSSLRDLRDPSRLLTAAGVRGEQLVAWVRLLLVAAALPVASGRLVAMPGDAWSRWAMFLAVAGLLYALGVVLVCRRWTCGAWLGYGTAVIDITAISFVVAVPLLGQGVDPETVSSLALGLYLLAIAAAGLRYVVGIALATGGLAMLEYALLIAVADATWRPDDAWIPGLAAGVEWPVHAAHALFMAVATFLATAAILRARQLRRVSIRDALTGLYNRGCFDETLEELSRSASRGGSPFAVALLDLDHFKRYNDTFGHRAGDDVLREVARRLTAGFRQEDVIGRYGGEEFGIVLPGLDVRQARERIEQLRRQMAERPVVVGDGGCVGAVTFSAGIAACPTDGVEAGEVLRRADACLYAAKAAGRDRLVTSSDSRTAGVTVRPAVEAEAWEPASQRLEAVSVGER